MNLRKLLLTTQKDWHPSLKALVEATPSTNLYPNFTGSPLSTWVFASRITLLGDAAHAHGGAYAAGGSLAIDDAYAFSLAIKELLTSTSISASPLLKQHKNSNVKFSPEAIKKSLLLYEAARKPHAERVLNTVLAINKRKLVTRREKGERETEEELRARMVGRADPSWLHEHDVEAAFLKAKEELLGITSTYE